ncbi:ankyrin repeat domain-containing protein [Marinilabiliaceae bacterium ANBcel2]|nr:ankyrin repeat domain-containing protein [Marinilabiliaceae bacterium ANBcel2]
MKHKVIFVLLSLLFSIQCLTSQNSIKALYYDYVQMGLLPALNDKEWTPEKSDKTFTAFVEFIGQGQIKNQLHYDLFIWLYNKGVSHEAAMITVYQELPHLFYILLNEGFEPPSKFLLPNGEEKLLINHFERDLGRTYYVLNKLLNLGYKADTQTLDVWQRHDMVIGEILNHPTNKEFVENNIYNIAQFLSQKNLLFTLWDHPLINDYNRAVNSLILDIKSGCDNSIEKNLQTVFEFLDLFIANNPKSNPAEIDYPQYITETIKELSKYAIHYDCAMFFRLFKEEYSHLIDYQWLLLRGGCDITEMILNEKPYVIDKVLQQEEIFTTNNRLVLELFKRDPYYNSEKLIFNEVFTFKGFSKEMVQEYYKLSLKNLNQLMEDTTTESIHNEYLLLYNIIEAIINDDVAYISDKLETLESEVLKDISIQWALKGGSSNMIHHLFEKFNISDLVEEDYLLILSHNPNVIDYYQLLDNTDLTLYKLLLTAIALSNGDKELIDFLISKGFDFSSITNKMITLQNLPNEQIIRKSIEAGMSLSQFVISAEYAMPYRLSPSEKLELHQSSLYNQTPLIYYIITHYPDNIAIELLDFWIEEKNKHDHQIIATHEELLNLAIKANRKNIVEHLINNKTFNNSCEVDYSNLLDIAVRNSSVDVLEPILSVVDTDDIHSVIKKMYNKNNLYNHITYATQSFLMENIKCLNSLINTLFTYDFYSRHNLTTYLKALVQEHESDIKFYMLVNDNFSLLRDAILNSNEEFASFIVHEKPQFRLLDSDFLFNDLRRTIDLQWFWLAEILILDYPSVLNQKVDGYTLLDYAIDLGCDESINLLIEMGAHRNIPDDDTRLTDLMTEAVMDDDYLQVIELYNKGASIDEELIYRSWGEEYTESYINYASRQGLEVMAFHLLMRGVNPNCRQNSQGLNPLSLALLNDNFETARILIQFGADIGFIPGKKAQQYFRGIEPGMSIKEWAIDFQRMGATLFPCDGVTENEFEKFQYVLEYESPDSLINLLNIDRSYLTEFFSKDGSDALIHLFNEKSFDYIERVFTETDINNHPFIFLHKAASIGRSGLVDLIISLENDTSSLYKLESPHYKHNIFEYNIKQIIHNYADGNSLLEIENYDPLKQHPPLSDEEKKALIYCIRMHSIDSNLDTTAMRWNFTRPLMYDSPEIFLTLLENYQGVDDTLLSVYRAIYNGDLDRVQAIIENSNASPNFFWYGCTALNWASINGETDIALLLLNYDIEVKTRIVGHRHTFVEPVNRVWKAPVTWAIIKQNKELARALVDNGEDLSDLTFSPFAHDPEYQFLFCFALESGLTDVLEYFIDKGLVMYDYGDNLTNLLNRSIKYDNLKITLKLIEGFGEGEIHRAYIEAGFEESYTAVNNKPSAIWYAISQNSNDLIEYFKEDFSQFDSVYYSTESLNIAIGNANCDVAIDILSSGIIPDSSLAQNQYRVRTLLTEGSNELYRALALSGWDKRRIIREARRVEGSSVITSPGWIKAYLEESDCAYTAGESILQAMAYTDNFEHLDTFLKNGGVWHSNRSFETNRTYLSGINNYAVWQHAMDSIIEYETSHY